MASLRKGYLIFAIALFFVLINISAFYHAYRFTHFYKSLSARTKEPEKLTTAEKIKVLFSGVKLEKPLNKELPANGYESIKIQDSLGGLLDLWHIPARNSRGTVILFHGYLGNKSELIDAGSCFNELGYTTVLVDFPGHGGSTGYNTTLGFNEAKDVKMVFDYVKKNSANIILYGESMGASAIMRAVAIYKIQPEALILVSPFGSLLKSVKNRFKFMHLPSFPLSELLLFWGSVQNKANLFDHKPVEYAQKINQPTLLLSGSVDTRATLSEVEEIERNLAGEKRLLVFNNLGHESLIKGNKEKWQRTVEQFLGSIKPVNK